MVCRRFQLSIRLCNNVRKEITDRTRNLLIELLGYFCSRLWLFLSSLPASSSSSLVCRCASIVRVSAGSGGWYRIAIRFTKRHGSNRGERVSSCSRASRRLFLSAAFSSFHSNVYERRCFGINLFLVRHADL